MPRGSGAVVACAYTDQVNRVQMEGATARDPDDQVTTPAPSVVPTQRLNPYATPQRHTDHDLKRGRYRP
jgi:hypothetical protein